MGKGHVRAKNNKSKRDMRGTELEGAYKIGRTMKDSAYWASGPAIARIAPACEGPVANAARDEGHLRCFDLRVKPSLPGREARVGQAT